MSHGNEVGARELGKGAAASEAGANAGKFGVSNAAKKRNEFLKRVPGEPFEIKETDGSEYLWAMKDLFAAGIDIDFKKWKLDKPGKPRNAAKAVAFDLVASGSFAQIFGSLSGLSVDASILETFSANNKAALGSLCLSQPQIAAFSRDSSEHLASDGWTLFLLLEDDKFFVVYVFKRPDRKMGACIHHLEDKFICDTEGNFRIIVPESALEGLFS